MMEINQHFLLPLGWRQIGIMMFIAHTSQQIIVDMKPLLNFMLLLMVLQP